MSSRFTLRILTELPWNVVFKNVFLRSSPINPKFLQEMLCLPVFLWNLFLFLLPMPSENFPRFSSRHVLRNVYSIMIQSKICCRRKVFQNSLLKAFFPRNSSRSSCSCSCNPSLKLLQFPYMFSRKCNFIPFFFKIPVIFLLVTTAYFLR